MQSFPNDDITKLLESSSRRPAVIHRSEEILEREEISYESSMMETEKGKYVVEQTVVQTTTRHVLVREFDPDKSYKDSLQEFIKEG